MAFSEAFLEWEQQTKEQTRQQERQAIALRLLQQGFLIEAIAQATELTIAEIQALQTNPN